MSKYLCGVPKAYCNGGTILLNGKTSCKAHSSPTDAFNCMARYLVNVRGYTRRGPREFKNPKDGYINVLTKKSRYGTRLRGGKRSEGSRSKRFTFRKSPGGAIGDGSQP